MACWPVYKGASFDLWNPDTGEYYAWADPDYICGVSAGAEPESGRGSPVLGLCSQCGIRDPATLPCRCPRVAFRDVARATDTRTVHCALVPPDVVITNKGPYCLWTQGDERDEAYVLGRPVIDPSRLVRAPMRRDSTSTSTSFTRSRSHAPGQTSASAQAGRGDCRAARRRRRPLRRVGQGRWACRSAVVAPAEKDDLIAELDAAVALLYGLDEDDVAPRLRDLPRRLGLRAPPRSRARALRQAGRSHEARVPRQP